MAPAAGPARRILITGAAGGIGAATARECAAGGARLALTDRDAAGLAAIAGETGGYPLPCDVTSEAEVDAMVSVAADALGGLDALITLAGINPKAPLAEMSLDTWQRVLAVNLTGTFLACRAALPFLRAGTAPAIVTMASGAAIRPWGPGASAYNASKGGVIALTRALALELGPAIRVNSVCPGAVDTDLFRAALPQEARDQIAAGYALGRISTPEEVARAIVFLAGPGASSITGIALTVDGGRSFH